MGKVIVSLVSEQTIPNILFLKENEGKFDKMVFVSSELMETRSKTESILYGSGLNDFSRNRIKILKVEEDRIYLIQNILNEETKDFINDEDEIMLNLTGGTKIMSIGVYDFFKERAAEIFYLPIGKNIIRQIFPRKNVPIEINIETRLDVESYFKAHAVNFKRSAPDKGIHHTAAKEIFEKYTLDKSFRDKLIPLADALRNYRNINKNKRITIKEYQGLIEPLKSIKWFEGKDYLQRDDIRFITGEWLEIFIYDSLQSVIDKTRGEVWNSVNIFLGENVDNELDVVFTLENALYTVECKTFITEEGSGSIINNIIYKAQAIRREFGLGARSILVVLDEKFTEPAQKAKTKDRARLFNIELITLDEIDSEEKVKDRFLKLLKIEQEA